MMLDKILCVDDDPITLMLCKRVISKAQFSKEIDSANNGEQAIEYLDKLLFELKINNSVQLPQLIFLDLNMPVMNGWEFLETFSRKKYSDVFSQTKIIVLSSTIDPNDIEKAKSYTMVIRFLSKPITTGMLDFLSLS
jgi:CheY-like chemotaxis protein